MFPPRRLVFLPRHHDREAAFHHAYKLSHKTRSLPPTVPSVVLPHAVAICKAPGRGVLLSLGNVKRGVVYVRDGGLIWHAHPAPRRPLRTLSRREIATLGLNQRSCIETTCCVQRTCMSLLAIDSPVRRRHQADVGAGEVPSQTLRGSGVKPPRGRARYGLALARFGQIPIGKARWFYWFACLRIVSGAWIS
jgi:hypothetical protein